ncbi:hypothetical protein SAMN04487909_112114 [Aneurinibacillus migulanus]|uniref:Uncharacterized protein n=1 Tax=Aneurinibacillus migulanus TaxID=47500 RepID=A0A1G8RA08_ANEMI|nr:hypothetical protein SAMN04487909_112114 [Aneurinibacillus migulanus]
MAGSKLFMSMSVRKVLVFALLLLLLVPQTAFGDSGEEVEEHSSIVYCRFECSWYFQRSWSVPYSNNNLFCRYNYSSKQ